MTAPADSTSAPVLVLFTGPPGTGKSTMADEAGRVLAAPVLGWDWAMAAMTDFDAIQEPIRSLSHLEHRRVGWSILWNIATAQLRRGMSVVLDGVARESEIRGCQQIADREGVRLFIVVTSCADQSVHEGRVVGRERGIPGWHELDWGHVHGLLARWTAPDGAHLYLDAMDTVETNAAQVRALLQMSTSPESPRAAE